MLVRFVNRKLVWAEPTEEILKVEFRDHETGEISLTPSVYTPSAADLTQLVAEHGATAAMRPQSFDYADLIDAGQNAISNCATEPAYFAHACRVHHELAFADVTALHAFVEERRAKWALARVLRKPVVDYVRARYRAGDAEWRRALSEPRCAPWADEAKRG